jgi:MFS transporter, YNFM family, putative membrane transport protein
MTAGAVASRPASDQGWVERGSAAYRRVSLAFFLAGFATFSLLHCVQPLLPIFAREFAVGPAQASLALSMSTGLLALAIFCAVPLASLRGRRELMFASMALAAFCNLGAAFAPGWHELLLARSLEGIALGGVPAVAMAYLAEEIEPRGLGFAMGLYVAGTAFGGMTGRVGTAFVAQAFGWRTGMTVGGLSGLAAAAGFWLLLPPARRTPPLVPLEVRPHALAFWSHLRRPALSSLFALAFLLMGTFAALYNYATFRLLGPPYGLTQGQAGLVFVLYLAGIAASSVAGALADRFGRRRVLAAGLLLTALGVAVTLGQPLWQVVLGIALLTVGFFTAHAVASGWVGRLAEGHKGHATSLYLLAYYLGASVLGSAGGFFWARDRWEGVALFTLLLLAGSLALGVLVRRGEQGQGGVSLPVD